MEECPYCGSEYVPGAIYCDTCGHSLPPLSAHVQRGAPLFQEPAAPERPRAPETIETEVTVLIESEVPTFAEVPFTDVEEAVPEKQPHLRLQLSSGIIIDLGDRKHILIGRKAAKQRPEVDLAPYGGYEQGVSRQHAVITFKDARYYIEDLGSQNETLLNHNRLHPRQPYPIKHGDQLQFGLFVVTVLLQQPMY